ncbi:unnamed protein product [Cuscuta epithymum]|uniref:F-box domain-containing protein n=1 Tax=Cuscuta epithymum TaxID=186058 RepID=A0AAV0DB14_9ASTE|nr:unnamed protein product [Cuscuta epithymum]
MSGCRETVISDLPDELAERIFKSISIRDAARCALLSTDWRDSWYRHGRLVFDWDFFRDYKPSPETTSLIGNILIHRAGPIKKFKLQIFWSSGSDPVIKQSDLDRWCLHLSQNGIEKLHLSGPYGGPKYKLPSCLFYCKTIKQLYLEDFSFSLPVNAPCIFPELKSSKFTMVRFTRDEEGEGLVCSMPKLEKLVLSMCSGTPDYAITTPELQRLTIFQCSSMAGRRWLMLHLSSIKTLHLHLTSSMDVAVDSPTFPTAINLQEITLHSFDFGCDYLLKYVVELLKKSPNLRVLEINIAKRSKETNPALLEEIIEVDFRMLETVKFNWFQGSKMELCLVKLLLSNSPALHHVVIHEGVDIDDSLTPWTPKKILSFPCASPKAQIVYKSGIKYP